MGVARLETVGVFENNRSPVSVFDADADDASGTRGVHRISAGFGRADVDARMKMAAPTDEGRKKRRIFQWIKKFVGGVFGEFSGDRKRGSGTERLKGEIRDSGAETFVVAIYVAQCQKTKEIGNETNHRKQKSKKRAIRCSLWFINLKSSVCA